MIFIFEEIRRYLSDTFINYEVRIAINTVMTVRYVETLIDPSYGGQILTLTYPLVGNYGVPDTSIKDAESTHKL